MADRYLDADQDGVPDLAAPTLGDAAHAADNSPVLVGTSNDARNRALRTFAQGLLTDLLVVAVLFLFPVFASDSFDFSNTDWKVLALSFAKTVVVTLLSYIARLLKISLPTTTA